MVAAENDALRGAKVGGVGDVLRDLPKALAEQGATLDVVLPSYGFLARLPGVEIRNEFDIVFSGKRERVKLMLASQSQGVSNWILHHPAFSPQGDKVYCNDEFQPFATDATKFAFFCLAVAEALKQGVLPRPDVLHCHDWHAAFLLVLIQFASEYADLAMIKTVFTIHNLAMQGVRPFKHDASSLEAWYPTLHYNGLEICDIANPFCFNPMRAAIRLADKVHTVSPTYAEEILRPSDHNLGIYGGEGLEADLRARHATGDLIGIINGCEYPKGARYADPAKKKVLALAQESLAQWASKTRQLLSAHFVAEKRLQHWALKKTRGLTLTFVGRLTEQKVRLFETTVANGGSALQTILDLLGEHGQIIFLGSGDAYYEDFLVELSGNNENFIFLNGYAQELSLLLYRYGDLFLMPSSFEPCGISQMLAMRASQPCLVNAVGGLRDTVEHNKTGFCFGGTNVNAQADALVSEFSRILALYLEDPKPLKDVAAAASEVRFLWDEVAKNYLEQLYTD